MDSPATTTAEPLPANSDSTPGQPTLVRGLSLLDSVLLLVSGIIGSSIFLTAKDIAKKIKAGGGKATLTTVEGGTLTAMMQGGKLVLTDEKGGTATVTIANVFQSNGVIHVIDTVLMPN